MVICLEECADLHMAQLMPLPLTVSCFSKIQIGFTFLVPAHLGSPGQGALKRVCVCALTLRFCDRNGIRQLITCVHLPISIGSLPETIEKANQWEHLTDLKKRSS